MLGPLKKGEGARSSGAAYIRYTAGRATGTAVSGEGGAVDGVGSAAMAGCLQLAAASVGHTRGSSRTCDNRGLFGADKRYHKNI